MIGKMVGDDVVVEHQTKSWVYSRYGYVYKGRLFTAVGYDVIGWLS